MDIFDNHLAKAMLIASEKSPFNSDDYIYEIKYDGIRCIAYITAKNVELRNKKNKDISYLFPELHTIFDQVSCTRCILDGELIVLKSGKPDFYSVQKRTTMKHPLKIKIESTRYPATFVAFDIVYFDGESLIELPLIDRRDLLQNAVKYESNRFCMSKAINYNGIELFEQVKALQLEGVVAKSKKSKYYFGKTTNKWIKFKVLEDIDAVICGYIAKQNQKTIFIIGQYDNNQLVYKGRVALGCSLKTLKQYSFTIVDSPPFDISNGKEDIVWLQPTLVCTIYYMPDKGKGFRQAVFKGIRLDKLPEECKTIKR